MSGNRMITVLTWASETSIPSNAESCSALDCLTNKNHYATLLKG
jgi:hypothetical protein